jgi:hypothetical protein
VQLVLRSIGSLGRLKPAIDLGFELRFSIIMKSARSTAARAIRRDEYTPLA